MTQINQYPITAAVIKSTDLFDIDSDLGGGSWESQKVPWSLIESTLSTAGAFKNIYTQDDVLLGNRKIRMPGNMATDLFEIFDNGGVNPLFSFHGDGSMKLSGSQKKMLMNNNNTSYFTTGLGNGQATVTNMSFFNCRVGTPFDLNNQSLNQIGNAYIGSNATGNGNRKLSFFKQSSAITSNISDTCATYADDQTAGNTCQHFRSENGRVSLIFQDIQANISNVPNTGDTNTDDLITAIKDTLLNLGVIAAS